MTVLDGLDVLVQYMKNLGDVNYRLLLLLLANAFIALHVSGVAIAQNEVHEEFSAEQIEFFEKNIRPVLVNNCYKCHSAEAEERNKLRGGLRVDTREHLLRGGDTGLVVMPGDPEESLLLKALNYESLEMPPAGQLPKNVIADFRTWIEMGLPDPRAGDATATTGIDIEAGRLHWAYQPLTAPAIPAGVRSNGHAPIDAYVLERLHQAGLKQVSQADRATLARRIYFDILGVPPTPNQLSAFINDTRPDAYERLVDQLLASQHFGERWGRHWLDIARYADSIALRGFVFPDAWRYRDYVVESFNADAPFTEFIQQQIAGDLLPIETLAQRQRNVIATTYLTLGNNNYETQDKAKLDMDVVDEQLETISRGLLAQTVGCARCHDHKFDPIPTRDYYALAGILRNTKTLKHANVSRWIDQPLPQEPEKEAEILEHHTRVAELTAKIKALKDAIASASQDANPGSGIAAIDTFPGIVIDDANAELVGEWTKSTYTKRYVGVGYQHDSDTHDGTRSARFIPDISSAGVYEIRFAYTAGLNRSAEVPVIVLSSHGQDTIDINEQEEPPIDGHFVSLGQYEMEPGKSHGVLVTNGVRSGHVVIDAVQFLPVDTLANEQPESIDTTNDKEARAELQAKQNEELENLEAKLNTLQENAPPQPKYMTVLEETNIGDIRIHIRGEVHSLGEVVPRGFLQVASNSAVPQVPKDQSGRRELAEWITSPDNPLTARVLVNRIWHWLLGAGIVRTVDNFGTTGEPPSHPELLDYLAVRLQEGNWRIKELIREIVLSQTYRLASSISLASPNQPDPVHVDPENRLLWRMNRRPMDAEAMLDAMLSASGQLQWDVGGSTIPLGRSADYGYEHEKTNRRALYWPVFRNSLPPIFDAFDFANPSLVTGRRNASSTASRALFLMNNPFVIQQARKTAANLLSHHEWNDEERATYAFELTLGRQPTQDELTDVLDYVLTMQADSPGNREGAWTQVVQVLFSTVDFCYVE